MKKITVLSLGLMTILLVSAVNPAKESSKKVFEKIVFLELTADQDSMLFKPNSKAWDEYWQLSSDVFVSGSEVMNYQKYTKAFEDRTDNLWTVLHPLIIKGSIQSYYPFSPDSYGLGAWDEGELRYPVLDEDRRETFLTSEAIREQLCIVMGMFGPQSDVPLIDEYGDPVIITLEDGTQIFKYPAPDYFWYEDRQIVKYMLRVRIEVNKKGKEKRRVIESFCPVVNKRDEMGNVVGEQDVLWFDFEELRSTLNEAYFLDKNSKPVLYRDYMLDRVNQADF